MDDDGDDKDDTKRSQLELLLGASSLECGMWVVLQCARRWLQGKSRNLSEKKRRDQFNMLVNELSSMISTTTRKMDKSTVLKSTISFLKNHNEISVQSRVHEIQEDWKPSFLSNEEFTHLILEALDGFIMVVSSSGRIFYASESITSLLGHLPSEILNTSIYDMAFDDDRPNLYNVLQNSSDSNGTQPETLNNQDNQLAFSCHIKRGCFDFREEPLFELVQFIGYFKTNVDSQDIEISPGNRFNLSVNENDTRLLFICTGRLTTPQLIREMSIIDSSNSEFISRHSLEWKFLFLDHRAPPIIGYLPFEVLGTSGYDYYHFDDLEKVVTCHEALMQKGEGTSCYYRFLTKGQQWIWLQTRFFITYHQWNSKPEFVVCTHRVVSCVDMIKSLQRDSLAGDKDCLNSMTDHDQKIELQTNAQHGVGLQMEKNSAALSSSWSKVSPKASRFSVTPEPYGRHSSTIHSSGAGSDTGSVSTESMISLQSSNTHHSNQTRDRDTRHFQFKRARSRHSDKTCSTYVSPQSSHDAELLQSPLHHGQQTNMIVHRPLHNSPLLPQYIDSSQYLAVPVQPVIGFPQMQAMPPSPDVGILMTPVQAQIQEQLQKKHEELQQMIIHQQKELRRVSERLVMARYGLLPPIINVSVPYSVGGSSSDATDMFSAGLMPAVHAGQQRSIIDQSMQQIVDPNEYIPMQMSQQQAQLLFSSPTQNQNLDREI